MLDRTCITWSLEFESEDGHEDAVSTNDDNLVSTVSSAGTWLKIMGSRGMASTAGKESDACGCAGYISAQMRSNSDKKVRTWTSP